MSDSSKPHGLQPTRLLCPWDFPGKSTGVGCHCLLRHCNLAVSKCWTNQAGLSTKAVILSLGKRVTNVFMYIKETVIRADLIDGFAIQVFFKFMYGYTGSSLLCTDFLQLR